MKPADALAPARAAGLPVELIDRWHSEGAAERLAAFFEARRAWGGVHNLSGPRALHDPWGVDLVDGAAVAAICPPGRALVDVGAGSGVPGLVVACLEPDRPVFLVEPIAKRTAFLRSAAAQLGLKAVRVERGRWPLPGFAQRSGLGDGAADVVSRAVVDPQDWPGLAAAGGPIVGGLIRMLAARRPPVTVPDFEAGRALDYDLGADGARRVERWVRRA